MLNQSTIWSGNQSQAICLLPKSPSPSAFQPPCWATFFCPTSPRRMESRLKTGPPLQDQRKAVQKPIQKSLVSATAVSLPSMLSLELCLLLNFRAPDANTLWCLSSSQKPASSHHHFTPYSHLSLRVDELGLLHYPVNRPNAVIWSRGRGKMNHIKSCSYLFFCAAWIRRVICSWISQFIQHWSRLLARSWCLTGDGRWGRGAPHDTELDLSES